MSDLLVREATEQPQHHSSNGRTGLNDTSDGHQHREILPAWVQRCSELAFEWKQALAQHVATHLLGYGMAIQVGSGTTFNYLMDEIIAIQRHKREPLDLIILTTNLQVMEKGRDARHADPDIFHDSQIILTGGSLQLSLHSLAGQYAAEGVRTKIIFPRIVFLGAAGLAFDDSEITLTYQFQDELSTQVSYATRPAVQRVILCDHTKVGTRAAWKAEISAEAMLSDAEECLIISTWPDDDEPGRRRIKEQARRFDEVLDKLVKVEGLENKEFALRLVNRKGEVQEELSLSRKRAEQKKPSPLGKRGS